MFKDLEVKQETLHINSFNLHLNSLEEIFIKYVFPYFNLFQTLNLDNVHDVLTQLIQS